MPAATTFIILAGGESRRAGRDKSEIRLGNQRLIELLASKGLELGFAEILLSGYKGRLPGCRTVPDLLPGRGPLGGLAACLSAMKTRHAFVIPVDCPGIGPETILGLLESHREAERDVTLLRADARVQPLIGVYPRRFAGAALDVIRKGPAPVFRALDQAAWGVYVPGPEEPVVLNLNTKEAWQAFEREYEHHRSGIQVACLD